MDFNWERFTKEQYEKVVKESLSDYVGAVHVGDICIDLLNDPELGKIFFDCYVLHEETGYGYTKEGDIPYDYADGGEINVGGAQYEEFKAKAEKLFSDYISGYKGSYSLVEHANRPLVLNW